MRYRTCLVMGAVCTLILPLIMWGSQGGANTSDEDIDAVARTAVIEAVLKEIDHSYVYPAVGAKIIASVRERLRNHRYDSISKASDLAANLTHDLQAVSADKHLRVEYHLEPPPIGNSAADRETFHARQRRRNFGFEQIERLPGNIGYLDLRTFEHANLGGPTAVNAMQILSNTEALIIDLRNNGGGHESMCQLLESYFLSPETEDLFDSYSREDNTTAQNWSFPYVPGARYGTAKAVYILTSKRTFSAAETFAYTLHNRKRAILVGEPTGGGANNGFPRFIYNEHFTVWIPFGTDTDPLTKTNWETVGVKPDLDVPETDAFRTAYVAALKRVLEATTDEELQDEIRASLKSAPQKPDPAQ